MAKRRPDDDFAISENGRPLPYSPEQVREITRRAIERGDLVAAIVRTEDGQLACPVIGEPSRELAEILRAVADAYAHFLKGH